MRVLVLGGDGYLGWPTAMHLSARGHEVAVVDNYFRRQACKDKDVPALFVTPELGERAKLWKAKSGRDIAVHVGDVTNYSFFLETVRAFKPDAMIHYAEQPSAPYSMLGHDEAAFTLQNNLTSTLNVVFAVRAAAPDCHIVKLGTMGEYGTPNIPIEEGWITIERDGRSQKFLYPRQAGSLYHTTKIQDTDLLYFYVRVWGLRVTDLMQGPVYGVFTDENEDEEQLTSHFNYDELFGTVLNRFMVQAVAGVPLTVYGKGGQTRGYLNIKDTMQCVRLAVESPPGAGELRIFNQFTEVFSVNELAKKVHDAGRRLGIEVAVENVANPRIEAEEHFYEPAHRGLTELGLEPNPLTQDTLAGMIEFVRRHANGVRRDIIRPRTKWR